MLNQIYDGMCFLVYPKGCENYYGPHSIECLKTMWNSSRCLSKGTEYPDKLASDDLEELDSLSIGYESSVLNHYCTICNLHAFNYHFREIIVNFNSTAKLADEGETEKQMTCYGLGKMSLHHSYSRKNRKEILQLTKYNMLQFFSLSIALHQILWPSSCSVFGDYLGDG